MKLGLINSAWVQANQPTVFGLQKTKELGFDTVVRLDACRGIDIDGSLEAACEQMRACGIALVSA